MDCWSISYDTLNAIISVADLITVKHKIYFIIASCVKIYIFLFLKIRIYWLHIDFITKGEIFFLLQHVLLFLLHIFVMDYVLQYVLQNQHGDVKE